MFNFVQTRRLALHLALLVLLAPLLLAEPAIAEQTPAPLLPIIADTELLIQAGLPVYREEVFTGVGYSQITPDQVEHLLELAHERGSCAGFEALPHGDRFSTPLIVSHVFSQLAGQAAKNLQFKNSNTAILSLEKKSEIQRAISEVSEANLRESVELLSSFPTRYHRSDNPNEAIEAFREHIVDTLKSALLPYEIELISHSSTQQKSIRVRLPGSKRPEEIIVLGGHVDSIGRRWSSKKEAPGADDNASGSSNVLEALRILSQQMKPLERTVEFFWYAGEEGGLLGSGEIAQQYKAQAKDVIAVVQLDMTLHPGDGEFTIASMTDFTSAWLRQHFTEINRAYLQLNVLDDRCGYACSDHATWYRQGYPTLMPTEARFRRMNRKIHTANDLIDSQSNFAHSAAFSRIAIALAMELGSSNQREPQL